MQILVAYYLHKCILLFPSDIELRGQNGTSWACGAERSAAGEKGRGIDPQAPGKSVTILVQESLWSQKQKCSIKCGRSYTSNT